MTGLRPGWPLSGHLGSSVSALVDGQLDDDSADRAWQHVAHCPPCRRLVEREGWLKSRLARIGDEPARVQPDLPDALVGSLLHLDPTTAASWADTDDLERQSRVRRRAGIALVGAGSVSAAVFGLTALGGSPLNLGGSGSPSPSSLTGPGAVPTPVRAVVPPASGVHGRLQGWVTDPGDDRRAKARR